MHFRSVETSFIYLLLFIPFLVDYTVCSASSDSGLMISGYSKVAGKKLGTTSGNNVNGSQSSWIPRYNTENMGRKFSTNSKQNVYYQYAVPATAFPKYDRGRTERIPAMGEVQERFNAKPYFNYASIPPKPQNVRINNNSPTPSFSQPSFTNNVVTPSLQLPSDSYKSPYTSYTPAPSSDDDTRDNNIAYPPLDQNQSNGQDNQDVKPSENAFTSYSNVDTSDSVGGPYPAAVQKPSSPNGGYGRPQKDRDNFVTPDYDMNDHKNYFQSNGNHHEVILDHPPPGYDKPDVNDNKNLFQSNGNHHEVILDHPPPGYAKPDTNDFDSMMIINGNGNGKGNKGMNGMKNGPNFPPGDDHSEVILDHPPPGYEEQSMNGNGGSNGMPNGDMDADLNPPPPNDDGKFPTYLYDVHSSAMVGNGYESDSFDDHHIYHEIEHPTTPPPQDERVNKGHYSYYYLGRKLWYIPLYFSIYFIIYVTVLILKSIARHKIHLKHEYEDHHHHGRQGRKLVESGNIDELDKNVTIAINNATQKYMM